MTLFRAITTAGLFVALCLAFSAGNAAGKEPKQPMIVKSKPCKVPLRPMKLKTGQLRPGYGITVPLPNTARAGNIEKTNFLFLDLDGNGMISTDGKDGLATEGIPFAVPLPRVLLLPIGQGEIAFDGGILTFTPQELEIDPQLIEESYGLTLMRLRAGVPPVILDPEICRHCDLHLDYLKRNNVPYGMALHD